jgi:protein SCO1/2
MASTRVSIMNTLSESRLITVLLLSCITVLVAGCRRHPSPNEKRYPINGKVIAVDKKDRTATIEHEDIVGYMPAMTMPFRIKNDADLEMMKPGDRVTGSLVVDDTSSWVEIATIAEGTAPLSPTAEVPGEPKPGEDVPDFGLMNQDGKRIHLSQYRGKALALTFVYTRCPQPDQ